jgi:pimeloyl-ACP methyl ester carboxylesterase
MYGRAAPPTSDLRQTRPTSRKRRIRWLPGLAFEAAMHRVTMRRSANRVSDIRLVPPASAVNRAYRPPVASWHDGPDYPGEKRGMANDTDRMTINGIEIELLRRGPRGAGGTPLVLLHGMDTVQPDARFLDLLGPHGEIIAPSGPGFGNTGRPADFDKIYDLVHLYLALIDDLPYEKIVLIGLSFGGWLAAEVALACRHRLSKLILVDPVGIKLGDRESRDILDVFNVNPAEVRRCSWHDPSKAPDYDRMSDDELIIHARNWEALCLYAWHPYMYNPQLKQWLGRIRVPTLVLWGESDRVVTPEYGRAYSGLIPGARFEVIAEAGHHPEIEQPERFVERVAAFLKE